jgi:type I restriction enzyme S subunit
MSKWTTVTLAEIADIRFSNVDKKTVAGEMPVRLCNYMDVYANNYITEDLPFMEATATAQEMERFKVEKGDNIITKDSETPDDIGIPSVVLDEIPNLVCGYHLALIKPKRERVDPIYLSKQLGSRQSAIYFSRLANGTTRYGLSSSAISSTQIPLAPLVEQRYIANVLSGLDNTIEKTESLITKYQQIKAGLMHDLFTRGITADGKLRPPREQAPELYHETPIGWIPKEWDYGILQDVVDSLRPIVYGILMPGYGYEGGVPVVKVKDIRDGTIDESTLLLTSPLIDQEYRRSRLQPGDILLTIRGSVGRLAIVPKSLANANITQDTARVSISRGHAPFYRYFLETTAARRHFEINTLGVAVQGINLGEVRKTPVPFVGLNEQKLIADRIDSCMAKLASEQAVLNKLRDKKAGLMHDLLTGKVRVIV